MRSVTGLKSLGDIRTTISTHTRSTPPLKGSTYLGVYLLDKERQRLETELAMIDRRRRRIEGRLGEIGQDTAKLMARRAEEDTSMPGPAVSANGEDRGQAASGLDPGMWRRMPIGY